MNKKVLFFIFALSIIVVGGGIFLVKKNSSETGDTNVKQNDQITSEVQIPGAIVTLVTSTEENLPPFEDIPNDLDRDGIVDAKEKELGLNQNDTDTDGDGLEDWTEIETFKTDPKNKDTDGDTFADGYEVFNGFNPNGPGPLPTQQP